MPNPNPLPARQAKKRRGNPGDLAALLKVVWAALMEADAVLQATEGDNPELALKAVHAVSQCAGQYAKLLEVGELEARIAAFRSETERTSMNGRLATRLTRLETHVEQHGWSQAVVVRLNPDGSEDWPDDLDGAVQVIYLPQKCATVEEWSATVAAPLRATLRPPGGTSDESADG